MTLSTTNGIQTGFPSLSPGVLIATTPHGGVVYDLVTETLSFVNPVAGLVLDACHRGLDRDATTATWADESGVALDQVQADVDGGLREFESLGLIGRDVPTPTRYPIDTIVSALAEGEASTTQQAGTHRIRFRSTDPTIIRELAAKIGLATDEPPTAQFSVVPEDDGSIRLITDTEWHFTTREDLLARVVMVVNDFVARTTTDVVLHAAALSDPKGDVVVFPAAPGSGKSTLAGLLVQQGWAYLGDESITVRHTDLALIPCAKPIELDDTSCVVLGVPPDLAGDVPLSAIADGATVVREPSPPPTAIIAPHYSGPDRVGPGPAGPPGAGSDEIDGVATLDFTDALVLLVSGALNLRYCGMPGLETLVALAATTPVSTMSYGSSAEALDRLGALTDNS